jgi:hypothetical protein
MAKGGAVSASIDRAVDRLLLELIVGGVPQRFREMVLSAVRLEAKGLIRFDYGPQGSAYENEVCCYPTERGREEIARRRKRRVSTSTRSPRSRYSW